MPAITLIIATAQLMTVRKLSASVEIGTGTADSEIGLTPAVSAVDRSPSAVPWSISSIRPSSHAGQIDIINPAFAPHRVHLAIAFTFRHQHLYRQTSNARISGRAPN